MIHEGLKRVYQESISSIVERYITKEAIEFCSDCMEKTKPIRLLESRYEDICQGKGTRV